MWSTLSELASVIVVVAAACAVYSNPLLDERKPLQIAYIDDLTVYRSKDLTVVPGLTCLEDLSVAASFDSSIWANDFWGRRMDHPQVALKLPSSPDTLPAKRAGPYICTLLLALWTVLTSPSLPFSRISRIVRS
jgi:hypothetical protein